jgi:hypothetical protein
LLSFDFYNVRGVWHHITTNIADPKHYIWQLEFADDIEQFSITILSQHIPFSFKNIKIETCTEYFIKSKEALSLPIVPPSMSFKMSNPFTVEYNHFATTFSSDTEYRLMLENLHWDKTQSQDYDVAQLKECYTVELIPKEDGLPAITNTILNEITIEKLSTKPFYPYLDTGYLTVNPTLKKRFREYQFGLTRNVFEQTSNESPGTLTFDFTFYTDSEQRQHRIAFSPYLLVDESGAFKRFVVRHFYEQTEHPEYEFASLGNSVENIRDCDSDIMLDTEMNYKVRIPISGKGYLPRFTLRTTHQKPYTIYNQALVYRTLNAR